jgi:hypothetical protein
MVGIVTTICDQTSNWTCRLDQLIRNATNRLRLRPPFTAMATPATVTLKALTIETLQPARISSSGALKAGRQD